MNHSTLDKSMSILMNWTWWRNYNVLHAGRRNCMRWALGSLAHDVRRAALNLQHFTNHIIFQNATICILVIPAKVCIRAISRVLNPEAVPHLGISVLCFKFFPSCVIFPLWQPFHKQGVYIVFRLTIAIRFTGFHNTFFLLLLCSFVYCLHYARAQRIYIYILTSGSA